MPEEFSFVFCFPASILCVAAVGLNQWSPWDGDGNGKAKSLFMDIRLSLTFASVGSICIYTGQTTYLSQTAKKKSGEQTLLLGMGPDPKGSYGLSCLFLFHFDGTCVEWSWF